MSPEPRDPRPRAHERRRAEVRALLENAEENGADEITARRLEQELAADPTLSREFLEDPGLDRLLRGERLPPPSELEWARIDAAIAAATGIDLGRGTGRTAAGRSRPQRTLLRSRVLVPLAAAALIAVVVVREAFLGGPVPAAEATIVEVDLPDDRSYLILAGEDESDGVMIFIASS